MSNSNDDSNQEQSKAVTTQPQLSSVQNQIISKAANEDMKKATVMTHYSRTLDTFTTRIMNILIHHVQHAEPDGNGFYWITIPTIKAFLGYESNDHKRIYDAIMRLKETSIDWNMFGQDQKLETNLSTVILPSTVMDRRRKEGKIGFQISTVLKPMIMEPTLFGRQKLIMVALLPTPSSAFPLYEFFTDYLSRGENPFKIELNALRTYLGIAENSTYWKQYKPFRVRVLDPSIKKINKVSEIEVSYDTIKTGQSISHLKFTVTYKEHWQKILPFEISQATVEALSIAYPHKYSGKPLPGSANHTNSPSVEQIRKIGVTKAVAEKAYQTYGEKGLSEILIYFGLQVDQKGSEIKDKSAYLARLLKEGIGVKTVEQRQSQHAVDNRNMLNQDKKNLAKEIQEIKRKAGELRKETETAFMANLSDPDYQNYKQRFRSEYEDPNSGLSKLERDAFTEGGWDNPMMEIVMRAYITKDLSIDEEELLQKAAQDLGKNYADIKSRYDAVDHELQQIA